jgi:hypothetical protein
MEQARMSYFFNIEDISSSTLQLVQKYAELRTLQIELETAINAIADELRRRGEMPGALDAPQGNRHQRRAAARRGR